MTGADQEVLSTIENDLLRPEVVERAVQGAVEYLRPNEDKLHAWREAQKAELARVEEELARLTAVIASGGDLPTLHEAVQDRKRRRAHLRE